MVARTRSSWGVLLTADVLGGVRADAGDAQACGKLTANLSRPYMYMGVSTL